MHALCLVIVFFVSVNFPCLCNTLVLSVTKLIFATSLRPEEKRDKDGRNSNVLTTGRESAVKIGGRKSSGKRTGQNLMQRVDSTHACCDNSRSLWVKLCNCCCLSLSCHPQIWYIFFSLFTKIFLMKCSFPYRRRFLFISRIISNYTVCYTHSFQIVILLLRLLPQVQDMDDFALAKI